MRKSSSCVLRQGWAGMEVGAQLDPLSLESSLKMFSRKWRLLCVLLTSVRWVLYSITVKNAGCALSLVWNLVFTTL